MHGLLETLEYVLQTDLPAVIVVELQVGGLAHGSGDEPSMDVARFLNQLGRFSGTGLDLMQDIRMC